MKKKRKSKAIKDLHLDRPTSHGGWPGGHVGSYTDPDTPVNQQIADYLKAMGLIDDDNPRARLSESTSEYNVYDPLSLQDPVNKIINAIIRSTGRPPDDGMKRHLYSKAIVDGDKPFFVNENKMREIIRESIKRYL